MGKISEIDKKKYFEEISRDYDSITDKKSFRYYLERRKKYLRELCETTGENKIIVDLGAGIQPYSESLSSYHHLINIDLSFNALKVNSTLNNKISNINANALKIPLKNNSVDVILLIGLLHHIPSGLSELFQEILRVIKNHGTIVIDEPNGYNIMWLIFMRLCEIDKVGTKLSFPYLIKKQAKNHGLTIERELYWGFIPPWPDKEFIINIFNKIGSIIEDSFLSRLCTRYFIILEK